MVSTTGFHPVNVGSIPAEVTKISKEHFALAFFVKVCYNRSKFFKKFGVFVIFQVKKRGA